MNPRSSAMLGKPVGQHTPENCAMRCGASAIGRDCASAAGANEANNAMETRSRGMVKRNAAWSAAVSGERSQLSDGGLFGLHGVVHQRLFERDDRDLELLVVRLLRRHALQPQS